MYLWIPTQQPLTKILVASAIEDREISSKFSILHSSKNSKIGDGVFPKFQKFGIFLVKFLQKFSNLPTDT